MDGLPGLEFDGFEWDEEKAQENHSKHGVTFDEAAEALDSDGVQHIATSTVGGEVRHQVAAPSPLGRMVFVVFTVRNDQIRIISARRYRK